MSYDIRLVDPVTKETLRELRPHQIRGGTYVDGGTNELWLNITGNYWPIFRAQFGEQNALRNPLALAMGSRSAHNNFNRGMHGDSLLMLAPTGASNRKPLPLGMGYITCYYSHTTISTCSLRIREVRCLS